MTQSTAQAITYYESAIEHGFVEAFVNLGKCYEIGDGVEENIDKAIECYQKAYDAKVVRAYYMLGCLYRDGKGFQKRYFKSDRVI